MARMNEQPLQKAVRQKKGNIMKKNYTHISIILDRSGSMESIREDIIGGFNAFVEEQKKDEGETTLTLVQFDSQNPYEVIHNFRSISSVPLLTKKDFVPRSMTPLLDAMGRGINDLESNLSEMKLKDRPEKVVMVFITDGLENDSSEFKRSQIVKMLEDKQEKNNWKMVFLSADLSALDEAEDAGVKYESTMAFDSSPEGVSNAMGSLSRNISNYKANRIKDVSFMESDRILQKSETLRRPRQNSTKRPTK
jgi:hypothetical protein